MNKMLRIVLISMLLFAKSAIAQQKFSMTPEEAVKLDPVVAAKQAIEQGDYSLLMVADCFLGIQGYNGTLPPEPRPKVFGETCEEMETGKNAISRSDIKEWATKYNQVIQQHNKALKEGTPTSGAP